MKNEESYDDLIDWFSLTFQEKLSEVHSMVLFPERRNKNKIDFLTMIIQRLIDKTDKMNNEEIENFLGYDKYEDKIIKKEIENKILELSEGRKNYDTHGTIRCSLQGNKGCASLCRFILTVFCFIRVLTKSQIQCSRQS